MIFVYRKLLQTRSCYKHLALQPFSLMALRDLYQHKQISIFNSHVVFQIEYIDFFSLLMMHIWVTFCV